MADPNSLNKPHLLIPDLTSPVPPNPSKSHTNFLCKSLIILFILVVLPLFPSQAPEIINQTIITKLWELLHLLFIGIAVSYGLFSRRNAQMKTEPQHSSFENSQNFLSGILHVSSIFEDGFENPNGFDEKRMTQTWNSQYFQSEPVFVSRENHVLYQCGKTEPFIDYKPLGLPVRSLRSRNVDNNIAESRNGSGSSSGSKGSFRNSDKVRKKGKVRGMVPINLEEEFKETVTLPSPIPWRSRSGRMEMREDIANVKPPSHSRPLSVGNFELESLKSRSFRSSLASQSSSISSSPKELSPSSSVSQELPNLEVENLERNKSFYGSSKMGSVTSSKARGFSIGSSSEMNFQRSSEDDLRDFTESKREESLGMREEIANVKPPSQPSSISSSPKKVSPSSSVSRELPNLETENLERNKSFYGSSKTGSLTNSKARGFSIGSSSKMNFQRSSVDDLRGFTKSKRDDPLGRGKCVVDSLSSDAKPVTDVKSLYRDAKPVTDVKGSYRDSKPVTDVKGLYRGKSVRTIRSNQHLVENKKKTGEIFVNRIDEKDETSHEKFEHVPMANNGERAESHYMNGEKQESDGSNVVESENDSESEFENFHVSLPEEEAESCFADESELECDEVDRKAGEFIAKFREQIRLQKTSSFRA